MNPIHPLGERKYRAGVASVFGWEAPAPLASAPSLAVTMTANATPITVGVLSAVAADITVTGVSADRYTLTTTSASPPAGLPESFARAWLLTEEDGAFPVTVAALSPNVVKLSEPLPRLPDMTESATITFSGWTVALPSSVTGSIARDAKWVVTYAPEWGGDAPTSSVETETGLLHVVCQPFDTRLTPQDFAAMMVTMGGTVPRSQQSWAHQISMGLEELVLFLRSHLAEADRTEDDVPAPQALRMAHAYYSAACAHDVTDPDTAESLRDRAERLATLAVRRIWVDVNQDGEADESETDEQLSGGSGADVGSFRVTPLVSRKFSIGGSF